MLCEISDLKIDSPGGRRLLDVPSLTINPGEVVGVRGPSGAGKSTLLFALAGLNPLCAGRIVWDGQDIVAMPVKTRTDFRRRHFGVLFQDFNLIEELSPAENAALKAQFDRRLDLGAIESRAESLLAKFGLTIGARSVASFSGGERQRVGLARALALNEPVIFADEPTANLDAENSAVVGDALLAAAQAGKTLIVASHDAALLQKLPRVITLTDGQIVEDRHV